jgi:protein-tyrosine phosphatase
MAEFMMKDLVAKKGVGDKFIIQSSATSFEEIGNPVHRGTRAVLDKYGISYKGKYAVHLEKSDYDNYDYFIGMDTANLKNMARIFGGDSEGKISLLLDYAHEHREVADPWWTGDFSATERDVVKGVNAFFDYLKANEKI